MEKYKIFKNKDTERWEIYSVYGQLIKTFNTEMEAVRFNADLNTKYKVIQAKIEKTIE